MKVGSAGAPGTGGGPLIIGVVTVESVIVGVVTVLNVVVGIEMYWENSSVGVGCGLGSANGFPSTLVISPLRE